MALQFKVLNSDTISAQATAEKIYPVTAEAKGVLIESISLTNLSTSENKTISVWVYPAGNSANKRYIAPKQFVLPPGGNVRLPLKITIENKTANADEIRIQYDGATSPDADKIEFAIMGVERDQ